MSKYDAIARILTVRLIQLIQVAQAAMKLLLGGRRHGRSIPSFFNR